MTVRTEEILIRKARCDLVAYQGIFLTPHLLTGTEDRAATVLRAYYRPLTGHDEGFTGGAWDIFDPSGTRGSSTNVFTADDVLACSLLATPIYGRAAMELLVLQRERFTRLLEQLGPDRDFVDEEAVDETSFAPAWALWQALRDLPQIGRTRTSKLMARKRPNLIPIFDTVILSHVFQNPDQQWVRLHSALRANGRELHERLLDVRSRAGLGPETSTLRVFDVLAWMDATGKAPATGA